MILLEKKMINQFRTMSSWKDIVIKKILMCLGASLEGKFDLSGA